MVARRKYKEPLDPELAARSGLRPIHRETRELGHFETLGGIVEIIEPDRVIERRTTDPMSPREARAKAARLLAESDGPMIRAIEDIIERQDSIVTALKAAGIDTGGITDLPREVRERSRSRRELRAKLNAIKFDS